MICRAGRTSAAFKAMSAQRKISLPGATSINSSDIPANQMQRPDGPSGDLMQNRAAYALNSRAQNDGIVFAAFALAPLCFFDGDAQGTCQDEVQMVAAARLVVQGNYLAVAHDAHAR